MVICLEHMAQLMPLPLTVSCFSKIQIGFTFLVPARQGSPGKRAVKRACVCVYARCRSAVARYVGATTGAPRRRLPRAVQRLQLGADESDDVAPLLAAHLTLRGSRVKYTTVRRFVRRFRCPRGRFVYRTREGRAA